MTTTPTRRLGRSGLKVSALGMGCWAIGGAMAAGTQPLGYAGVDDADMARVVGIRVSQLFTIVFALGAALAAFAGIIGAPILSVYPGLDQDMLPPFPIF